MLSLDTMKQLPSTNEKNRREKAVTQAPYICARDLLRVSFQPGVEMNCFGVFEISSCSRHGEPNFILKCSFFFYFFFIFFFIFFFS